MLSMLLAVQLLAGSMPGATPSAPGVHHFVQLTSIEGLAADSASRERFMSAFRDAFSESDLPAQSGHDGEWKAAESVTNHFRLLEGSAAEDAWQLQVVLGVPPLAAPPTKKKAPKHVVRPQGSPATTLRRTSRGLHVTVVAISPEAAKAGARPIPFSTGIAFPLQRPAGSTGDLLVPRGGYDYPWEQAGRAAAMVALDRLHHLSEDLPADERLDVTPALLAATGR